MTKNVRTETKNKKQTKSKEYAMASNIQVGDKILIEQDKADKLTTAFNPATITVVAKQEVTVLLNTKKKVNIVETLLM